MPAADGGLVAVSRPLAVDLFAGLGGWADGLLAEGWAVAGFDIERHIYGEHRYPAMLAIQDVLTLHGSQFKNAALIVASPPCQEYSYMAMPWSKAKAIAAEYRSGKRDVADLTRLFDACFRIQREACEAAGRHIPLIVENVRGAIPWVGRSRWNFGSFHLWGDVPALMPMTMKIEKMPNHNFQQPRDGESRQIWGHHKLPGFRFDGSGRSFQTASVAEHGVKVPSEEGSRTDPGNGARFTSRDCGMEGTKNGNDWFGSGANCSLQRRAASGSNARKAASAMIARIPEALARHIARAFRP